MEPRSPSPIRVAAAILVTAAIMLALPSAAHLILGGPAPTPLAWSALSLVSTALASVVGVGILAWRPPSGLSTVLAAVGTGATMTALPIALAWVDRGAWPLILVYLVVYGVYLAIVPALAAAAVTLHGRDGVRFRIRRPA